MGGKRGQARRSGRPARRTRQQRHEAGMETVSDLVAKIKEAQQLYDSESADLLIGEPPESFGVIQRAVEAEQTQAWLLAKSAGAQESRRVLKMWAQHLIICLDLNYRSFAAGVDHGRRQALKGSNDGVQGEASGESPAQG